MPSSAPASVAFKPPINACCVLQETYPDVEKARRLAMPATRVSYGSVERDAALEAAKMIQVLVAHCAAT